MGAYAILLLVTLAALAGRDAGAAIDDQITIGNTRVVVKTVIGSFEGDLRVLELEDDVYHNELVETGEEAATKLVFLDETSLTLGADSQIVLDSFVFDPDPSQASFVMTAVKGVFRFASGKLPKNAYRINTPAATIGVRGTTLTVSVVPADGADGRGRAVVEVVLEEGEATVTTCAGEEIRLEDRAGRDAVALTADPAHPCAAAP